MRIGNLQPINENSLQHIKLVGEPTVGSPAEADFWYDGTSLNFRDSSSTIDLLTGGAGTQYKMKLLSKDLTEASGTIPYTGFGFQPTHVIFMYSISAGSLGIGGLGFDDGTIQNGISNQEEETADLWIHRTGDTMDFTTASGARQLGEIDSFDSDGFTIDWTKVGSPTGTGSFAAFAFK